MAKTKDTKELSDNKVSLKELLKAKAQTIYEREPVQAFAEGNLNALVDSIDALYK